ncbi:MAG: carbohydrate ABC transporter permease [Thermotogae bacterium]|nr:carbohydrate ABC transporter permease [Candidatus Neomarinimicrobiota bacterium]RKX40153.1 MAG: carbohydrate ABC transporter permease [Thermotogota bacterium]RKX50492.1 MAG: carbohydrate ABC transporter permease [Thermotogota bacterium]
MDRIHPAWKVIAYVIAISIAISMILPFLWMVSTSLKDNNQIFMIPPQWIPKPVHWENYKKVFELLNFGRYYLNTIIVTAGRMVGMFFVCTMAGYAFARLKFPGREVLFILLLSSLMIPFEVLMVPTFILIKKLHWINTYQALIIPQALGAFGGAFNVFLMRQFFATIPKELEEAAIIEGASPFRIFWNIMLPLVKPAIASLVIFTFSSAWNDFTYPLIVTNTDDMKVLSLGIAGFKGFREGMTQWNLMMASATISILPVVIVFLCAQKYFVEGITTTGMKD